MSETGSYVYAAGRQVGDLSNLRGLRDAPLRVVEYRDLGAIVSTVDLGEFGEDPLRRHLEDLDWLEQVARGHDQVVRAAWAATGAVAPFRLATICHTDEAVRARLITLYDDLVQALDRVAGRSEWSVKVFLISTSDAADDEPLAETMLGGGAAAGTALGDGSPAETAGAGGGSAAGTAYLMRRREELARRQRAAVDAQAMADEIHRGIALSADASRRLTPQDRRLSGYTDPMILNSAYLVNDDEVAGFRAAVDEFAVQHPAVRITVDGPWPPYSFTTLESA